MVANRQGSKKHPICKQSDIRKEGSNKKRKPMEKADKFIIHKKLFHENFDDPRNNIPSKIPSLTVATAQDFGEVN